MNVSQEQAMRLGFWATLLLSVFAWAPATYPGYWQATEGFVPVFNAVAGGAIAGIATAPDLWRGMGNAAFLPAQPFLALGLAPTVAVRIAFGLCFVLGGLGMYSWLRNRLGDRAAGLAALIFMFWPPLIATVYVRGSLADAVVVGVLPLALAGLAAYVETRAPSAAGVAVLSLLWIWRTQAGLAVFVTLLLLAYVLLVERSRLAALVVGVSGAAGLVSLIPLWQLSAPAPAAFETTFVSLYALLSGGWPLDAFGLVAPVAPALTVQGMTAAADISAAAVASAAVTLGPAVLVLGTAALWFWYASRLGWRATVTARLLAFAAGTALIALLSALPMSQWLWQLSGASRLVTYPWQLLLAAAPFFALLAGSLPALQPVLAQTRFWSILVALVLLGSYPYLQTDFTQVTAPERPVAVFGAANEIVILEAQLTEDTATQSADLTLTWQVLRTPEFDYNVFFQALTLENNSFRAVAQLDVQPLQGLQPATTWQPGQIYTDTYRLDLAETDGARAPDTGTPDADTGSDASTGAEMLLPLRFDFGYYDWRDGSRLPIDGGIDDKLMFYGR